jgi:hypothetical protein
MASNKSPKSSVSRQNSNRRRPWLQEVIEKIDREVAEEDASNAQRKLEEQDYAGDDTFAHDLREVVQALIRAPRIEVLWKAFERRSDPSAITRQEQSYRQGLESAKTYLADKRSDSIKSIQTLSSWCVENELRLLRGEDSYADDDVGRHIQDMAYDLIGAVTEIRSETVSPDTKSKRRQKLREVLGLVDRLKQAIEPLYGGASRYSNRGFSASSSQRAHAVKIVNEWIWPAAAWCRYEVDREAVAVAYQLVRSLVRRPNSMLDTIVEDVAEWADEVPELARPNDPNAERLLFIRKLTAYFRGVYGLPLRGCVLAITEAFFNCETLDAAAIAKLAP